RLEQRREFNLRVETQLGRQPVTLENITNPDDLTDMEYRSITVMGEYDHTHQVALRNQVWNNILGVHLLTPLKVEGTDYTVLVNRGWIPMEDFTTGDWSKFNEPGLVEVTGIIRNSQTQSEIGRISDPVPTSDSQPITAWNLANLESIERQMPYLILPVYIQQAPDHNWISLPYRSLPDIDLTEGSHFGYAIQWFTFATILGFGYPIYLSREIAKSKSTHNAEMIKVEAKN
ncbi:MAG: SURF1 family protein, partial [Anaerolineales bacterium]